MPDAAASVFGERLDTARRYAELLATRGVEWGLIGPREVDRIWERHVLNSVAVSEAIPAGARVIDVGSGAGLPGIPLALARPDVTVTLLEPLLRRANFLTGVVEELGLAGQVDVVRSRAEDTGGSWDVVTCRAVAPLPRLLEWCASLVGEGGRLVALKGANADTEVADATRGLRRHRLRASVRTVVTHEGAEPTRLIVCER